MPRQLEYKDGAIHYKGYVISWNARLGYESDYTYIYEEWEASSRNDFTIVEENLDALLEHIDHRLDNNLTGEA